MGEERRPEFFEAQDERNKSVGESFVCDYRDDTGCKSIVEVNFPQKIDA